VIAGVRLDEDYHVHSSISDDAVSTVEENLRAARERGLRTLCLAEHVRRDSTRVPEQVAAVAALPPVPGMRVLAGVEAKILDTDGRLDLPDDISGIDIVLIADHQFPAPGGPLSPREIRRMLDNEEVTAAEAVSLLVLATAAAAEAAAQRVGQASLAHLFSILPKIGLSEADVPADLLGHLVARTRQAGAHVEVNEKWACPSAQTLRAFAAAGVPIVASTDSHSCSDIGVYDRIRRIAGGLVPAGRR
jgi:putative hydrolase